MLDLSNLHNHTILNEIILDDAVKLQKRKKFINLLSLEKVDLRSEFAVEELCDRLGVSSQSLAYLFKSTFGCTMKDLRERIYPGEEQVQELTETLKEQYGNLIPLEEAKKRFYKLKVGNNTKNTKRLNKMLLELYGTTSMSKIKQKVASWEEEQSTYMSRNGTKEQLIASSILGKALHYSNKKGGVTIYYSVPAKYEEFYSMNLNLLSNTLERTLPVTKKNTMCGDQLYTVLRTKTNDWDYIKALSSPVYDLVNDLDGIGMCLFYLQRGTLSYKKELSNARIIHPNPRVVQALHEYLNETQSIKSGTGGGGNKEVTLGAKSTMQFCSRFIKPFREYIPEDMYRRKVPDLSDAEPISSVNADFLNNEVVDEFAI